MDEFFLRRSDPQITQIKNPAHQLIMNDYVRFLVGGQDKAHKGEHIYAK